MRRVMRQHVRRRLTMMGCLWVVGKNATNKSNIVTGNPVVCGPYGSRDDSSLARPTISACPKDGPARDDSADK